MHAFSRSPGRLVTVAILLAGVASLAMQAVWGPPAGAAAMAFTAQGNGAAAPSTVGFNCGRDPSPGFDVVPAPDAGSYSNSLYGVASLSSSDGWAVGEQYSSGLSSYIALIEHWNGSAWSVVQGSPYGLNLRGIAAISSNDIWAVGWMGGYGFSPFTEHWNGSQWTYVQSLVSGGRRLYGVAAVSSNDVWAVGQSNTGVLIFHWDGTQWSASPVPGITGGVLYGVTAISANDVWAVGTADSYTSETIILHWNGSQWSRVASPNSGAYINVLTATAGLGPNDIWAVGYWATSGVEFHGYTLHWDGSQWSVAANPTSPRGEATPSDTPTPAGTYLYGVSASKRGGVWAVGRNLQIAGSTAVALALGPDGWTRVRSTSPGYANSGLYAVAAGRGSAWAVGAFDTSSYGYSYPLTEQYGNGCLDEPRSR
jgi:hypothetical protein